MFNSNNTKCFGERLKKARLEKGLKQAELAKSLNLSNNSVISSFERGSSLPSIETLIKISEVLEVDLHWLITGDYSKKVRSSVYSLLPFIDIYKEHIKEYVEACQNEKEKLDPDSPKQKKDNLQKHIKDGKTYLEMLDKFHDILLEKYQ